MSLRNPAFFTVRNTAVAGFRTSSQPTFLSFTDAERPNSSSRGTHCLSPTTKPMNISSNRLRSLVSALAITWLGCAPAMAEMSAEELAKLAQNAVGNVISVPFQNNTNLNYGSEQGTQNILNIQPVIPT